MADQMNGMHTPSIMEVGQQLPSDPHAVIDQIAYCDAQMEDLRNTRRQLVNHYQLLMQGFEKHYHEVASRVEMAESPMDMPAPKAAW